MDGITPEINIQDLRQPAPKFAVRKNMKRKVSEGTSQKTPKAAKKKFNSSFIYVVEFVFLSTYETSPSPKPVDHLTHQTIDDFDIEIDTSLPTNSLNNPPSSQPEIAQVLHDIDHFEPFFDAPKIENLNNTMHQISDPHLLFLVLTFL